MPIATSSMRRIPEAPTVPDRIERFVLASGHRTRVVEQGRGPVLLLIPSPFLRIASYKRTIASLSGSFRVIAAELPGSGRSQGVDGAWGFARGADWAAELLDVLEVPRAILVGHSNSGPIVGWTALAHTDRVAALVLADSTGARPEAGWGKLLLGRLRDATFEEPQLNPRLGLHLTSNLVRHPRTWFHHVALAASTELLEIAPRIAVPTLIAWGRRDRTFPAACAERLRAAIPASRIAWSEGSHDWLIGRPDEFAGAVAGFARERGLLVPSDPPR